ncbi:hypothetical protein E4U41_007002, partial [Claviceps citrina]
MAGDFTPLLAPVDEPTPGKAVGITTPPASDQPGKKLTCPTRFAAQLFVKSVLAQRHKYFVAAAIQLGITTLFPGRFAAVPVATLALAILTTHLIDRLTPSPPPPPAHMLSV